MSIIRDDALSLQEEVIELESATERQPPIHDDKNLSHSPPRPDKSILDDYQNYPNWVLRASHAPLLAGTTGPLSLLISLSGLADPWRQTVDGNGNSIYDPKPTWVKLSTAIALAMEIIGNSALFLNFYGKLLSYKMAMTISLTAFPLKVGILFGTIGAFRQIYPDPGAIFYSQGFWLTIASSILTTFTALLLLLNLVGHIQGYYDTFRLNIQQRLLMLQVMAFFAWVALGAAVFGAIEHLRFVQSLYFVDVTLLTVGFGDVTMTTPLGRALLIPYAFIGILLLGLVVASIRSVVLEDARERLVQRHVASIRARKELARKGKYSISDGLMTVPGMALSRHDQKSRYEQMRKEEERIEKTRARISAGSSIGVFIVFWCMGAAIFSATEGWNYFEGFYFCFVSLTTIGYGDFAVNTDPGRSIFIVWSLLSIPLMTILISMVGDTFVTSVQDQIRAQLRGTSPASLNLVEEMKDDEIHMTRARDLPDDPNQLLDLVQKELPEELLALSEKLIRYASHVSETKATPKYPFDEYVEMVEKTRAPVLQAYETNHIPEELQFLRYYSLAVVRVTKELKQALTKLEETGKQNTA